MTSLPMVLLLITYVHGQAELETTKLIYGGDSSVRGDGGGRGCEVRADATYTIPEHKTCKNCWHSKGDLDIADQLELVRIDTGDEFHYEYIYDYGVDIQGQTSIKFTVMAANDAHLALSTYKGIWLQDSYEIVIGGWVNQKSVIRKCDQCLAKSQLNHAALNGSIYIPFWISWAEGYIRVGQSVELFDNEILSWQDPDPFEVNYIGISTGWNANGSWVFGYVSGGWSHFGNWSDCNASCGGGIQSRERSCDNPEPLYGLPCDGVSAEYQACNGHPCPVNGSWSGWASWGECSETCGDGVQVRERECDNPRPMFGGTECPGNEQEEQGCYRGECPIDGNWTPWTPWSSCSATCNFGKQTRSHTCTDPEPQHGGEYCDGLDEEISSCFIVECPINGNYSEWSDWSECSHSCGEGNTMRNRSCDDPVPQYGGEDCEGPDMEVVDCFLRHCPISGDWSAWSAWGLCSLSCGNGSRSRTRLCDDPEPQYGGDNCTGHDIETEHCKDRECPIAGSWSTWSLWSSCSHTCGPGIRERIRTCDDPEPQFGGEDCPEKDYEEEECQEIPCAIDGGWTDWEEWSSCSLTCGRGIQTRNRSCANPEPQHGGANCTGDDTNTKTCLLQRCPVDGQWSSWTSWSWCSYSCGHGIRERIRFCEDPAPQYGGLQCNGTYFENETCYMGECPIHGAWTRWTWWTECSTSCGGGWRSRERFCEKPEPQHGGRNCSGQNMQNQTCNFVDCESSDPSDRKKADPPVEAAGAVGIGVIGLALVGGLVAALVILDLTTIHRHFRFMKNNINFFLKRVRERKNRSRRDSSSQSMEINENVMPHTSGDCSSPPPPSSSPQPPRDINHINLLSQWQDNRRALYPSARPVLIPRKNLNIENNLNKEDTSNIADRYRKSLGSSNVEVSATHL